MKLINYNKGKEYADTRRKFCITIPLFLILLLNSITFKAQEENDAPEEPLEYTNLEIAPYNGPYIGIELEDYESIDVGLKKKIEVYGSYTIIGVISFVVVVILIKVIRKNIYVNNIDIHYCPKCGAKVESDSIYCEYCGYKIHKKRGIL